MYKSKHLDDLAKINLATETYVVRGNKLLMFRRSPNAKMFPNYWTVPGGHVDREEDALSGAIREIYEETGIKVSIDDIKLKAVTLNHHIDRNEVWVSFVFLAYLKEDQEVKRIDEEGNSGWLKLKSLSSMENVFPPLKIYFDHVLNDKPGIMYTNTQMKNAQLLKIYSQTVDRNG
jgi:ADP-ribose pyrophosphatase YjhB (NUDIX family)